MSTTSTAVLQIHQREVFERNVTRALAAGAGAGLLAYLTQRIGLGVPLSFLVLAGTALAAVRGDRLDRMMLSALALVLPAAPHLMGLSAGWTVAFSGAAAGALMVRSRASEKGGEAGVGVSRPGPWHYALGAVATAGLGVAGLEVARVLASRMAMLATPAPLTLVASGVVVALFASIGGLAAHLMLKSDPVEARCEELIPTLTGELHTSAQRALQLYRQCGESLAALPREPGREELARTLQQVTKSSVELAAEWNGVEQQLVQNTKEDLERQIAELTQEAKAARDAIARKQLQMAAASLKEELDRLSELSYKRERILAKLKGQLALLERAKVALIGMRSGHAQVKAAELSALARKFGALATAQADEARIAHEAATGAELSALPVAEPTTSGEHDVLRAIDESIGEITGEAVPAREKV